MRLARLWRLETSWKNRSARSWLLNSGLVLVAHAIDDQSGRLTAARSRLPHGYILLPPCCHKDQGPTAIHSDQASDLHFLVAGAGFEPATSGL